MRSDIRRYALRLQITTACQLRCGYCRPDAVGTRRGAGLLDLEMVRACRLLSKLGVDRIRLTGGEPLLREDIVRLVARLAEMEELEEVTLTTNGQRLADLARPLRRAGLHRVNVHIDSLDAGRYRRICGGDLGRALDGLAAAVAMKLSPRVNVVVQRGLNEDEIPAFCALARELGVIVRFIEIMDTGIAPELATRAFVSGSEIGLTLEALGARRAPRSGSAPAVDYRFADGTVVGVIASETEPFCESCDRLRLGLDGVLRTCLYAGAGLDVGALLRSHAPDRWVAERLRAHIAAKRSEHPSGPGAVRLGRGFSMAAVGG
ncbi:MAG TPA: radical SAM protein [Anaeromyxobacter sp.]